MIPRLAVTAAMLSSLAACASDLSEHDVPQYGEPWALGDSTPHQDSDPLEDADGGCGETHLVDMTLTGYVIDDDWQPVADHEVWVEERHWFPRTVYGSGTTDETGRYALELTELPIVEGCWGVGPQFFVASQDRTRTCEVPANMQLVIAWLDGTLVADISGYPCVLVEDDA